VDTYRKDWQKEKWNGMTLARLRKKVRRLTSVSTTSPAKIGFHSLLKQDRSCDLLMILDPSEPLPAVDHMRDRGIVKFLDHGWFVSNGISPGMEDYRRIKTNKSGSKRVVE